MADFNSKYSGEQVESLLDMVANGEAGGGGGGGITVETDPIFSASPAATITEAKKTEWDNKYSKPSGGIPASDLASDVFLQGEKGEQGPKGEDGEDGVGIASVVQTTTSNADGGSNIVTVTLTDGTTSTFTVKNGSKGSQGEQGPKGDKGDTGANGTNGTNGVSVSSIKQTTTSTADGGTNVVTVTLSNGTTSTFNVKNGSKGSNGTNGTNGKDGADGATFTPSVDSEGNLSWTNNKGLTNPPTVNIKGPKGDKGDAGSGGGSGGSSEIETIYLVGDVGVPLVIDEMLAEKRYCFYLEGSNTDAHKEVIFLGFEGHNAEDTIAIKHFYAVIVASSMDNTQVEVTLSFPDGYDINYPNGKVPEMTDVEIYELSITQVTEYGWSYYNVVVTPFAPNYD